MHETHAVPPSRPADAPPVPPLRHGDRLTRDEFERRYDAMPHVKKAELINGVVHMPSPVRFDHHGRPNHLLGGWLFLYEVATPGVLGGVNVSVRLDLGNEPQPDSILCIDPARGGQMRISADDYAENGPELAGEISASSAALDFGDKLLVYQRNGVREYIIWHVPKQQVHWFVLRGGRFEPLAPDAAGVFRSEVFPGLWLDAPALLRGDLAAVQACIQKGIATAEHAAFVERLRAFAS
jgi:hypothetical protein